MSDSNEAEKPETPVVPAIENTAPVIHGIAGDTKDKLSLRLYVVPRGDDVKPDYVLATNQDEARRGALLFFGKNAIVGKAVKTPPIGHRVLVQIQERDSQPNHLGFVMDEWSKEHLEAAII